MPPRRRMPDIDGIDPAELALSVLAIFEEHGITPELRRCGEVRFGALLDHLGGAPEVLAEALRRLGR